MVTQKDILRDPSLKIALRREKGLLEPDRIINGKTISGQKIFRQRRTKKIKLLERELRLRGIRK